MPEAIISAKGTEAPTVRSGRFTHLDSTGSESAARLNVNSGGCVWGRSKRPSKPVAPEHDRLFMLTTKQRLSACYCRLRACSGLMWRRTLWSLAEPSIRLLDL